MSASPSTMAASTLPAKRKRTQVSYVEPDDELSDPDNESGDNIAIDEIDDELPEGDSVYGSRKKPTKAKGRKKLRFTRPKPIREIPFKPFPFLSLPPELRDYIYELALTDDNGITLVSKTKSQRRTICRGSVYDDDGGRYRGRHYFAEESEEQPEPTYNNLAPNLLAVNKQINSEGLGYLYQQPIVLEDTMTLHTFLAAIGPTNRLQLSDISIKRWGTGRGTHKAMNVAALTILAGCTNLKVFNFDCRIGWLRRPKFLAQQIYRDGHYFFEAYGAANGRKDAAVDVLQLNAWNFDRDNYFSWGGTNADQLPERNEFKEAFQAELRRLLGA